MPRTYKKIKYEDRLRIQQIGTDKDHVHFLIQSVPSFDLIKSPQGH